MNRSVLAFDFGASSGRAMLGSFDGEKVSVKEIHRFSNDPEMINGLYYWDIVRLFHEIKTGLLKAKEYGGYESIGIDTWGVDFGLLDSKGRLVGNVYHYRDARNEIAAQDFLAHIMPMEELYRRTGIQYAPFNTVFQLHALKTQQPYLLENAEHLLFLPDLFDYFLTGKIHTDYSEAPTSGLLDVRAKDWDWDLIDRLGVPRRIFSKISSSGEVVGALEQDLCDELMIDPVKVISVASHDTASAVAAVPSTERDTVYISCGTWSLFGTELDEPNTSDEARESNLTNEGGCQGKIRFLKNIMGTWLIQQSRRYWNRQGHNLSYDDLEQMANACTPFQSVVDVDDSVFLAPGDIPVRIQEYCRKTNQPVPQSIGEIMQCIYCSIALRYRYTFDSLKKITGKEYTAIHMVGGGIQDKTLCRLAANTCGVKVIAGPIEATVIGNVMVQLIAGGAVKDLDEARRIVKASFDCKTYLPEEDLTAYKLAYLQYRKLIGA